MIEMHFTEDTFKCEYCDFIAKNANILNARIKKKHPHETMSPRMTKCTFCKDMIKSNQEKVDEHMKIHTQTFPLCDICAIIA